MAENVDININVNAGDGSKSVGQLGKSIDNLKGQFDGSMKSLIDFRKELKDIQVAMSAAGAAGDKAGYDKLKARYIEVKDAAKAFREETIPLEDHMGVLAQGMGNVVGIASNLAMVFGADSKSAEELFKTFAKVQAIQNLVGGLGNMIDLMGKLPSAINAVSAALQSMGKAAYASLGPWGLLAIAIAAVVVAIAAFAESERRSTDEYIKNKKAIDDNVASMKMYNDIKMKSIENAASELSSISIIISKIGEESTSREKRNKLIKDLDDKYPGYLSNMDKEKLAAGDTASAYDKLSDAILKRAYSAAIQDKITELTKEELKNEEAIAFVKKTNGLEEKDQDEKKLARYKELLNIKQKDATQTLEMLTLSKELFNTNKASAHVQEMLNNLEEEGRKIKEKINNLLKDATKYTDENTGAGKDNEKQTIRNTEELKKLNAIQLKNIETKEESANATENETNAWLTFFTIVPPAVKKFVDDYKKQQDEISEAKEKLNNDLVDGAQRIANAISEIIANAADADVERTSQSYDRRIQTVSDYYDKQIKLAEDAGQSTVALEDQKQVRLNKLKEEAQKETEKIEEKANKKRKAIASASVIIDTAQAVMGFWKSNAGIPVIGAELAAAYSILAIAEGAAQLALINSQKFATGGYVKGVGNQDTVPAMLTPGEFVIKKDVVEQINSGQIINYDLLASKINDRKIIVVESDITKSQKQINKVETHSTF